MEPLLEDLMRTMEIRLPEPLAKRLDEETVPADQAVVEALEAWLERRERERVKEIEKLERERVLEVIRSTGLWRSREDQRAFVEKLMSTLGIKPGDLPSHEELRQELEGVPPLSELIIAERNEGR